MAEVALHQLTKRFDAAPVVEGIDLEVRDGELLVLVGPSGCGKTTLLRMIAGLETPTSGEISIGGRPVTGVPPKDRDVAMVFQNYALYPHMSVFQNLAFGLKMRRTPRGEIRRRVAEAAALLGIEGVLERKPAELSGGQQQRVALGRALVREPAVFLLDEPLSNLDAQLRVAMRTELVRLHRRIAATLVYVTHDQTEAMMMGNRVVVIEGGRIRQAGPPMEIYRRPADRFVAEFIGAPPMNFLEGHLVPGPEPTLRVAERRWPVPPELQRWTGAAEMPVAIGIRPEALLAPTPDGGISLRSAIQLECEVELVQPLGADSVVLLRWRGHSLQGAYRSAQVASWRSGEQVHLAVDPRELHVFDRGERGRRLGRSV